MTRRIHVVGLVNMDDTEHDGPGPIVLDVSYFNIISINFLRLQVGEPKEVPLVSTMSLQTKRGRNVLDITRGCAHFFRNLYFYLCFAFDICLLSNG